MRNLVIIGAGGFGREVYEWASASSANGREWLIKGFIDDASAVDIKGSLQAPLLGSIRSYKILPNDVFAFGIGAPNVRNIIYRRFVANGAQFVSIVHPTAVVCSTACVEIGAIICPYAIVSADATIGAGSVIYYHSSVDHDVRIGRFCQISGHCDITGGAVLGDEVFVGSHAIVLPSVIVGDRAIIGAGAVVTKKVTAGAVVYGVPARSQSMPLI